MTKNGIAIISTALALFSFGIRAETFEAARTLGFTDAEIQRVRQGAVLTKESKERSDKELAGVAAIFFEQPLTVIVQMMLEGDLVKTDPDVRIFCMWAPGETPDKAFSRLQLEANEKEEFNLYCRAAPGIRLNLAEAEIQRFRHLNSRPAVNAELQNMLWTRYEEYRKDGLKGTVPYVREGKKTVASGEELSIAIEETPSLEIVPGFARALRDFPAPSMSGIQHRFFAYKQVMEERPTFILSHHAALRGPHEALITEQRYYVSHTYDCRFIAGHCFEVSGGTLLFYFHRTFTDRVAGLGTGVKHSIGRKRMLADVALDLKNYREHLQPSADGVKKP